MISLLYCLLLLPIFIKINAYSKIQKLKLPSSSYKLTLSKLKYLNSNINTNHDLITLINPSYNLAAGSAVLGTICGGLENFKGPTAKFFGGGAIAFTLFGGFLAYQASTIRFQFDDTHFSLVNINSNKQQQIGQNIVVGGDNSWKYDTFVNWDFLPSEDFPILVYFKEIQTSKEKWVQAPIVIDDLNGQAHFFPVIGNVQELKQNFIKYKCAKISTTTTTYSKT